MANVWSVPPLSAVSTLNLLTNALVHVAERPPSHHTSTAPTGFTVDVKHWMLRLDLH